jgi:hypothetical protein
MMSAVFPYIYIVLHFLYWPLSFHLHENFVAIVLSDPSKQQAFDGVGSYYLEATLVPQRPTGF